MEEGIVTDFRLVHPSNIYHPNDVTEEGIVTDFRLVHPLNMLPPKSFTVEGIVNEVKLVQFSNSELGKYVIEEGIVTDFRLVHPLKRESGKDVMEKADDLLNQAGVFLAAVGAKVRTVGVCAFGRRVGLFRRKSGFIGVRCLLGKGKD